MKRTLLVAVTVIAAASLALGQKKPTRPSKRTITNDKEALEQLVRDMADAVIHFSPNESAKLDRFADDNFRGSAEGISYNKGMLVAALTSGQMKVARWDCNRDDMRVRVRGNSAVVTGRCTLGNATYMGKDYSGGWHFTDHFVKQKDGSWRAVSSQARRIKQRVT